MREGNWARGPRNGNSLPAHVIQDRLERYFTDEPLRLIAADHGVNLTCIIATVHRHAPWAIGMRARGGGRREWPV